MARLSKFRRAKPIAIAPRPWLSRCEGECAFPVAARGWTTRACCNPCGRETYCEAHRVLMRGPPGPPIEEIERDLRRRGI